MSSAVPPRPPARVSDNPLVRLSLRRPITMLMVLLSMLVLGAVAWLRIPLELIPSGFAPPFMQVEVAYPDATAKDVEERIARPLEQALATTPHLEEINTTSSSGSARVVMVFEADADMDVAYRQVRDRVARARADLPSEVENVQIRKESGASVPVAFFGVVWDPELADPNAVIDRHLVRAIERIDGVGLVNLWGNAERQVRIDVDRSRAEAAGVDLVSLVQTLSRSNFTLASGNLSEGNSRYLLRSVARWDSVGDIEALVVGPNGLRLDAIADVSYDRPPATRLDRYRGRPSMVLFVIKESQANTVEVSEAIKKVVAEATSHPEMQAVDVETIFVQGDTIRYSLQQVVDSGIQGGLIALVVLVLFLRRLRLTLIIALSIPLSLFLALPVMYFTGQSINIVSLIGLMICIGLVVDNSVVVAENIGRFRKRGLGPHVAALQGAGEVGLAITLATMTTIVVFLPAALLSKGMTQFFMVRMVTPVCVSLVASLFVALVLIPLGSASLLSERKPARTRLGKLLERVERSTKGALAWVYEGTMGRLGRGYAWLLRRCLHRRIDVVLGSLLALASMAIPAMHVRCASEKNFGTRSITVHYSMPSETTLGEADAFFRQVEQLIESHAEELHVNGVYVGVEATFGQVQVFFDPPQPDEPPFEELTKRVVELLPERPGWKKSSRFGDSDGARDDSFPVALYGDDHETVQQAREDLEARLVTIDGVLGIAGRGQDTRRRDELVLTVDRSMSQRYGVPAQAVGNTVAFAIRGTPLPRFHTDQREVDVWLRYREEDRRDVDQLLSYPLPTQGGGIAGAGGLPPAGGGLTVQDGALPQGAGLLAGSGTAPVPLAALADKTIARGQSQLTRNNKRVAVLINLEIDPEQRFETIERIDAFLADYRLPEGLSFDADSERRQIGDMQRDLFGALALGTVFIFLLMGFLFESFVLPLSVLPSIPLSFVGVWWFLYITGEHIDALAGIGIVLLLGVVVNNAIVLIDFVNRAREDGLSRVEAIVAAGRLRFRPIMMTSLTTIAGMLPLAFTPHTGEGIPYGPFGKALVGGMTTATILTLIVVPVVYTYLDDMRIAAREWTLRLLALRAPKRPPS